MTLVVAALAQFGCAQRSATNHAPAVREHVTCDRVAAPGGSDRAPGTVAAPRRTVGALLRGLRPGSTACLRAGTYREDVTVSGDHLVLRAVPGERVTIVGRLWVTRRSRGARFVDLHLDGRNRGRLPSPTVNGTRAAFVGVDVTNRHTAVCFLLGSRRYGRARSTSIERSRIHDCGRLPSNNREHGIYIDLADDTRIVDDVIYDNADRGIQLYSDAQRTVVERNVIDGNGEGVIFSGDGRHASSHAVVRHNLITGSRIRADVESWYPPAARRGVGNRVEGNCVWGGRPDPIDRSAAGFGVAANVTADPGYRDRANGDFRLRPGSPCEGLLAASRAPAGPRGEPPVSR